MEHLALELARQHSAELRRDAARQHLARLAACCRPDVLHRALAGLMARFRPARSCCA